MGNTEFVDTLDFDRNPKVNRNVHLRTAKSQLSRMTKFAVDKNVILH